MRAAAASRAMHSQSPDELRADLEDKAMQLMSVQRNYESMSRLMQMRQQEIEKLKLKFDTEASSCVSLGVQLEEARARADNFEAQYSKLKGMPDQLIVLQEELKKLRYDASVATSKFTSSSDKVGNLQKKLEDTEFQSGKLHKQLDAALLAELKAKDEVARMKKEMEDGRADARALNSELRALRDQATAAHTQTQAAEKRAINSAQRLSSSEYKVEELLDVIKALKEQLTEGDASHRATKVSLSTLRSQYAVLEGQLRSTQRSVELSEQYNANLMDQLRTTKSDFKDTQTKCQEQGDKIRQLSHLLSDSEERYQSSLTQRVESDEVMTGLQAQLVQSRTLLGDARRRMQEIEDQSEYSMRQLRNEERAMAAHANDLKLQLDQERFNYSKVMAALLAQVEAMSDRLVEIQSSVNTHTLHAHDKAEKAMSHIAYKVQVWEQRAKEMEEVIDGSSSHLSAIRVSAEHRASLLAEQRHSLAAGQAAVQNEAAAVLRLQGEVERLQASLMQEQYARQTVQQASQRQELEHQEAMSALRGSLDERVELERTRLGARMTTLEAEAARLELASKEAYEAAEQAIALERAQMQRAIDAAKAGGVELAQKLQDLKLSMSNTNRHELAALSTLHNEEMEKIQRSMAANKSDLKIAHANVMQAWEAEQKLLADMKIVTAHLTQMGWDIKQPEALVVAATEDGSGLALAKFALLLRLNFSYVTEAVQQMAKAPPQPIAPPVPVLPSTDWSVLAKDLRHTINKIIHVEESLATNCTCMLCMDVFTNPVTCNPCGHTYCKACFSRNGGRCKECGDTAPLGGAQLNPPLDAICSKYDYKLSALKSIQKAVQQGSNSLK